MLDINHQAIALSPWVLLYLSIATPWLTRKHYWGYLFLLAIVTGLLTGQLELIAGLMIGLFGLMAWLSQSKALFLSVLSKIVLII